MNDEITIKKAKVWDLMMMREQLNADIAKLNQEIFELVQKERTEIKEVKKEEVKK